MGESKHTPGKLHVADDRRWINRADGIPIAMACGHLGVSQEEGEANAARIVHTWNSHDELFATLIAASHTLKSYAYGNSAPDLALDISIKIDAVITKATAAAHEAVRRG